MGENCERRSICNMEVRSANFPLIPEPEFVGSFWGGDSLTKSYHVNVRGELGGLVAIISH